MNGHKIYLATPYSSDSGEVIAERVKQVNQVAARLFRDGFLVFSPISHSHPILLSAVDQGIALTMGFESWSAFDKSMIDWCDELVILTIDGWRESKGVRQELEYALDRGKRIGLISSDGRHTCLTKELLDNSVEYTLSKF